jgi:hypothetical protein
MGALTPQYRKWLEELVLPTFEETQEAARYLGFSVPRKSPDFARGWNAAMRDVRYKRDNLLKTGNQFDDGKKPE